MTVIKFDGAEAGDCIQVGGGTERCTNLYSWPTDWETGVVIGKTYTASINVSNAKYNWKPGSYTVSFSLLHTTLYFFIVLLNLLFMFRYVLETAILNQLPMIPTLELFHSQILLVSLKTQSLFHLIMVLHWR